ncbi:MAG: DUF1015 domain-containing protein [Clostridia bacterium]|nr:DUF1015 domain-containing protein [Clostridia bacterium]
MAKIKPFKALRFNTENAGDISTLVCPPYDIISPDERAALVKGNEYNMVNLELPVGEDKYNKTGKLYREWLEKGILKQDADDTVYIYEEEFTVKSRVMKIKGIITRVFLEEFSKGVVLPHEETLSKAKADRFDLMCATGCNFSQIYSLYNDADGSVFGRIDSLSQRAADVELKTEDGIIHRLWLVTDKCDIDFFEKAFADKQLFIADGHHRYETAINYRNKLIADGLVTNENDDGNFVMMMLVDLENKGLEVFPTHRLVRDLPDFDLNTVVSKLENDFSVEKIAADADFEALLEKNNSEKAFVLYAKDEAYFIKLKNTDAVTKALPDKCDAYNALDVAVLHSVILEPIFNIDKENMAKQINLTYTRDIDYAVSVVDSGEFQCAFILNPTKVSEIRDVALANEKMPQKSTYFYPKIITGLVINKIL